MAKWDIKSDDAREAEGREKWGDEEYERRVAIAAEKVEQFPKSQWKEQQVIGGQFRAIALAVSEKIFDRLQNDDYRMWSKLVHHLSK